MRPFEISVKQFNDFALDYANRFKNLDGYQKYLKMFCALIETRQPKVLELACGPGNVTKYLNLKLSDSKIIAIDLAPRMIEIAKAHVKQVDFRVMDVRDIHLLNLKFDAVMCSFCLPFLSKSDTSKLISDCSTKLAKNGILYISTMEGDESKAGFESTSFSGDSTIYFNYHRQQDLENLLLSNGFLIHSSIRQNYYELDGSITIDLIIIAKKTTSN